MAFIALDDLTNIIFIEHFVVLPKYRNQGLGSRIVEELLGSTSKMICLEVDKPINDLTKKE